MEETITGRDVVFEEQHITDSEELEMRKCSLPGCANQFLSSGRKIFCSRRCCLQARYNRLYMNQAERRKKYLAEYRPEE